jgi:hypothetical protein
MENIHEDFKISNLSTSPDMINDTIQQQQQHQRSRDSSTDVTVGTVPSTTTTSAASSGLSSPANSHRTKSLGGESSSSGKEADALPLTHIQAFDWTYTTDYCLTFFFQAEEAKPSSSKEGSEENEIYQTKYVLTAHRLNDNLPHSFPASSLGSNSKITKLESSGINYEMLKNRDLPILFYDEIILYEVSSVSLACWLFSV